MQTSPSLRSNARVTRHAALRLAQRGICVHALELLTMHGIDVPAGRGQMRRELRGYQVGALHAEGFSLEIINKALRLEAIFTSDETLVTCYQRTPRHIGRGYRASRQDASLPHRRNVERAQ